MQIHGRQATTWSTTIFATVNGPSQTEAPPPAHPPPVAGSVSFSLTNQDDVRGPEFAQLKALGRSVVWPCFAGLGRALPSSPSSSLRSSKVCPLINNSQTQSASRSNEQTCRGEVWGRSKGMVVNLTSCDPTCTSLLFGLLQLFWGPFLAPHESMFMC